MRKALKITAWTIAGLLTLLVFAAAFLNSRWGQNIVRAKAEKYLAAKLGTEVRLGFLGVSFPKYIIVRNVLLRDQQQDTLLSLQELKVNMNMTALLRSRINVEQIVVDGLHSHVYRGLYDTAFNYDFIIRAFAGSDKKKQQPADTASSTPPDVTVGSIVLSNIHLRYDDYPGGTLLSLGLNRLELEMKHTNLAAMDFHIGNLLLDGTEVVFVQDTSRLPPPPPDTSGSAIPLVLAADKVQISKTAFRYNNRQAGQVFAASVGDLILRLNRFDLLQSLVDVAELDVRRTGIVMETKQHSAPVAVADSGTVQEEQPSANAWKVRAGKLALDEVSFRMDDDNQPHQPLGIDYAHLYLTEVGTDINNVSYSADSIAARINHLALNERSGLHLRELKATARYDDKGAVLSNFLLSTSRTLLQHHLEVHYPSLSALQSQMGAMQLNVALEKSHIGMRDVLLFVPSLDSQALVHALADSSVYIDARINGTLSALTVTTLSIAALSGTGVSLSGKLTGLPDAGNLVYDLGIEDIHTTPQDASLFLPDSLQQSLHLPQQLKLSGQVAGTVKDYNADLSLVTSEGNVAVRGFLHTSPGEGKERYRLSLSADRLNIGAFIGADSIIGPVTAAFVADGTGLTPEAAQAQLDGGITAAEAMGYTYRDIRLTGSIAHRHADVNLLSNDRNAHLLLKAKADLTKEYPGIIADLRIDSVNLHALGLYEGDMRLAATLHADMPVTDPDYPRGSVVIWQPDVHIDGRHISHDSLIVSSRADKSSGQNLAVDLGIITASVRGKVPLSAIPAIIQQQIAKHYVITVADTGKTLQPTTVAYTDNYSLQFAADVPNTRLLHDIVPDLKAYQPLHLSGEMSPQLLQFHAETKGFTYAGTAVDALQIKIGSADSALQYRITAGRIGQERMQVGHTEISGRVHNNTVSTMLSVQDADGRERFALAGTLRQAGDSQTVSLSPGLVLDYEKWTVAQPNAVVMKPAGMYISNLNIANGVQYIRAVSSRSQPGAPLSVDIKNFSVGNITRAFSASDTLLAGGVLSGKVVVEQFSPTPVVTGDMTIDRICVMGDSLGNVHLTAHNQQDGRISSMLTLQGHGNDVAVNGAYYTTPVAGEDFRLTANVRALAASSFSNMAKGQMKDMSGYLRGNIVLHGTVAAPLIDGELRTDNLRTTVAQLNTPFSMPDEHIVFKGSDIVLNSFNILDKNNNRATIAGTVDIRQPALPRLALKVNADKWTALQATAQDNKLLYGRALLSASLNISGLAEAPAVNGTLRLLKGTDVTIVNPDSDPQLESRKGIVVFRNMKDTALRSRSRKRSDTGMVKATVKQPDINITLIADKEAKFTLFPEHGKKDYLSVQGSANVAMSLTPGGAISLTGSYLLEDGAYQLNYSSVVKRRFRIAKGSSITFSGDPVANSAMNITALYEAQVAPYDLVQREVDPTQLTYYRQRLPFNIAMYMTGPVLKPYLSFDILLPGSKSLKMTSDQQTVVQSKLSQIRTDTSELNKQVFAVLVLNRFVSDDPFNTQSPSGGGASFAAMQSVSTFLGDQLNRAADRFIKGVDFSVDLATTEDYTSGSLRQRTDLNLAASKKLLDDRLKITLGNNFELEGPQGSSSNNSQAGYIPSNLAADYMLTPDGKYTIRAYRQAYDVGVLQGFVTEAGVNFIVSLDYNNFSRAIRGNKHRSRGKTEQDNNNDSGNDK